MKRQILVLAVSLAVGGIAAAAAMADPTGAKKSTEITVTCPETTYDAVVNGSGEWSPAHDLNSNGILIPVAFGVETDVFTPSGGSPEAFFTEPRAKGASSPNGAPLLYCTYGFALTFPDDSTLQVSGSVTGFVTPAGR